MPIVKLAVFGRSEQITTTGKNLWSLGDISFNGYKELSVNYPAGNYVLSYNVDTSASSTTVQVGINVDGIWKYYQVKKDNRVTIKISSNAGITVVRFYAGDSPAYNVNARYYDIQMENSTEATAYEPYTGGKPSPSTEYPQEITAKEFKDIKIHGKNLLGGKYHYTYYSLGIGTIKENISNPEPIFPYTPAEENRGVGKIMYCKKGTTYTLSVTNANSNYAISIAEYASIEDAKNKDKCIGNTRVSSTDRISYTASSNGILLCYIAGKWTDGTTTIHTCTDTEFMFLMELNM